jgi:hypothetical protein
MIELIALGMIGNDILDKSPKKKQEKMRDSENSIWSRLMHDPTISEPEMFTFVKFRQRFRTPYPFF